MLIIVSVSNMAAVAVMLMEKTAERAGEFAGSIIPTWPIVSDTKSPEDI